MSELKPKGCFYCQYFYINPPIVREPYTCLKGAKQMPDLWTREVKVADDCPLSYGKKIYDKVIQQVVNTPTIEAEPKHGKWIYTEYETGHAELQCSECGEGVYNKTKFCPNCGAKMDERSNER